MSNENIQIYKYALVTNYRTDTIRSAPKQGLHAPLFTKNLKLKNLLKTKKIKFEIFNQKPI